MNIDELSREELLNLKAQIDKKLNKTTIFVTNMLKNVNINYKELSERLSKIGINESNKNLSNKINLGKFTFEFVLQIADVLDKEIVVIDKNKKDQ